MAITTKIPCPKCGSEDCNETYEHLGELIKTSMAERIVFCNHCTYTKATLIVGSKEIVIETQEASSDECEVKYMYLGSERA